ncbi:MAG: glycosyltransferase family 4 protein [Myxococcota bacterium]
MNTVHWLSPGDPNQRTGGYLYNARMIDALRARGVAVSLHVLDGPWPWPGDQTNHTDVLSHIPDGSVVVADGLLWPGLQDSVRSALSARCAVWVVVHSLLDMEESSASMDSVVEKEMQALSQAHGWFATSSRTARIVCERLNTETNLVIVPGTFPSPHRGRPRKNHMLSVATVTERKGHRLLVEALAQLKDVAWTMDIVGALDRDVGCVQAVRDRIQQLGLEERIRLVGELDDAGMDGAYSSADLLVHTATFEAFGMGLTEALVRGIPVVSTPAGALDSMDSAAIQVLPAQDLDRLVGALRTVLADPMELERRSDAAELLRFPDWSEQAERLIQMLGMESVGFSIDWLRQREPYDHAARSTSLVDKFGVALGTGPLRLMEIATGLGSGTRFVSPRLPNQQHWTLVDHDPQLLNSIGPEMDRSLPGLDYQVVDHDLRDLSGLQNHSVDAVLTQALLDLASEEWLVSLADWLAEQQLPFLASLTVDGRVEWTPADQRDAEVQHAFRVHQTFDRGFGASPGPQAAQRMKQLLEVRGFDVCIEKADWSIPSQDVPMVEGMLDGIAWAASEAAEHAGVDPDLISTWYRDRKAALSTIGLRVGHIDLLAIPQR